MRWTDISETILYRGDASLIDQFDITKTDNSFALFGRGIYLTDSPEIAADYTLKSSGHVVLKGEDIKSPRDAIMVYIAKILMDRFDWKNIKDNLYEKWSEALRQEQRGRHHSEFPDQGRALANEYEAKLQAEKLTILSKLLVKAKAVFKQEASNLRIVKDTTGQWMLVKPQRDAYLSCFDIPEDYMKRVFHAEEPMPDDVLATIKSLYLNGRNDDTVLDMRDAKSNFMTFDGWVKAFKTIGIDYAWADDDRVKKGRGNPSFDMIRNGTHYGGAFFHDMKNVETFTKAMQALGYVGVEYYGGARVGAYVRGGGGLTHRAYCFWNDRDMNKFRVETKNIAADDADVETRIANSIRAASIYKTLWQM